MVLNELEERYRNSIIDRAKFLIETYERLDIVYLRVSTKTKGQQEGDQLPDILRAFELDKEKCLLIEAQESAYKEESNDSRRFNLIYDLIIKYNEESRISVHLWDLDRAYRNRERLKEFFIYTRKYKVDIFSYNQKFINDIYNIKLPMGLDWLKYFIVDLFINFLGWIAEDESRRKGERLKKSLKLKDGRYYSNKNRLVGRKLKDMQGKKLTLKAEQIDKIEQHIIKCIKADKTYVEITDIFSKNNIKISLGYISNIKKKYLNK